MASDGQNRSDHTAKRSRLILRRLALIWTGLAALIVASVVVLYWQGPATALGLRLAQVLLLFVPPWLLLSLCALGLWVSLFTACRRQSGGRVWPVLTGTLAVAIAITPMLIVVAAVCSQPAHQDACVDVAGFYYYLYFCFPGVCTGGALALLPVFCAALVILAARWVARQIPRPHGKP